MPAREGEELRDAVRLQAAREQQATVRRALLCDPSGARLRLVPRSHRGKSYRSSLKLVGPDSSEVIGAVLAGGRGTRIGTPKATIELGGRLLLEHPLTAFAHAGIDAVVVAKVGTS